LPSNSLIPGLDQVGQKGLNYTTCYITLSMQTISLSHILGCNLC